MSLESLLDEISIHFSKYRRPAEFINAAHCCECRDHFDELNGVGVDDLVKSHVGDGAWDPTCFLTPDGFRYYFPALARIATSDRTWLEVLAPRLSLSYVDSFDAADRDLVRQMLEAWWADDQTDEWTRLAVERALDHFPAAPRF